MEIVEIERGYKGISIKDNTIIFTDTSEVLYVHIRTDDVLPEPVRVIGVNNNADETPISHEELVKSLDKCRSLRNSYVADKDIRTFECSVKVTHTITVNNKKMESEMPEIRYFEASIADLEEHSYTDVCKLSKITITADGIVGKSIYSLDNCINPTIIEHPGSLSDAPGVWKDVKDDIASRAPRDALAATRAAIGATSRSRRRDSTTDSDSRHIEDYRMGQRPVQSQRTARSKQRASGRASYEYLYQDSQQDAKQEGQHDGQHDGHQEGQQDDSRDSVVVNFEKSKTVMTKTYNYEESLHSFTLDIICVYLKGQKLLYIEAKVYCEQYLYSLMLPAIFITAVCSVISVTLNSYTFGGIIVSCFTAINSFILSLITYLKLDAKAEAHKMTAYSFEKLQSTAEFSSGRILFSDKKLKLLEIMDEIGTQVKDIKEKNQFILPEAVRHRFPVLYSTNVFSEVKRIQNKEIILMSDMKNYTDEGITLKDKLDRIQQEIAELDVTAKKDELKKSEKELQKELETNIENRNSAYIELIEYRKRYIDIDNEFKREIDRNIRESEKNCWKCCQWLKN